MRLVTQLVAVVAVAFLGSMATGALQGNAIGTLVAGLAAAALMIFVYARVVRWTERRAPAEVAARTAPGALARGLLIGAGMFGLVVLNFALVGLYRVEGLGSVEGAVALIGFMAAAAVWEELVFRGILFRIAEKRIGTWWAMGLTALLFGLMHLANQDASLWGAIAIAIEAGLMLAAAYVATRNLWVPIGVHFGWNYAGAGIFSTVISGNGANQGLLDSVISGPALITGGDFGPEASPNAVLIGLLVTAGFLWLARRRGNLVPRRRRAQAAETVMVAE
jgi:Predicted metal-dependent membrane protease